MICFELTDGSSTYLYKYPEKASELTLDTVIRYEQEIDKAKPEMLRKLEEIRDINPDVQEQLRKDYLDSLDPVAFEKACISFYMREIQFFTNMKLKHLTLLPVKDTEGIDIFTLRNLIRKSFINVPVQEIDSFVFLGKKYYLPPSPPNLFDPSKSDYMRGSKVGEYATASELMRAYELMKKGRAEGLLNVIAVICRKKGEEVPVYPDEQTEFIKERASLFRSLDYQTALNIGFFLTRPDSDSGRASLYLHQLRKVRARMYQKNTAFT